MFHIFPDDLLFGCAPLNLLVICVMVQFSHDFLHANPFNLWPQLQQPQPSAHLAPTDTAVSHL